MIGIGYFIHSFFCPSYHSHLSVGGSFLFLILSRLRLTTTILLLIIIIIIPHMTTTTTTMMTSHYHCLSSILSFSSSSSSSSYDDDEADDDETSSVVVVVEVVEIVDDEVDVNDDLRLLSQEVVVELVFDLLLCLALVKSSFLCFFIVGEIGMTN